MVRKLVIPLVGILLLGAGAYGYHQYDVLQQAQAAKDKVDHELLIKRFRDAGIAARKSALTLPLDPLNPDAVMDSDQAEIAQAKLWQKLSPKQREAMRSDPGAVAPAAVLAQ